MKTIWKYHIAAGKKRAIEMPKGAQVLSVQTQHNECYLWALVDAEQERETRFFVAYSTGDVIENRESLSFVSTFQINDGQLVFHLFEEM